MKVLTLPLLLCLGVPVVVSCGTSSTETSTKETLVIDIRRVDTWEASIKRANENLSEIADALISVAKDGKQAPPIRRKAILLLGRLASDESHAFLISNVSLHIPKRISGDLDAMLETPCMYALCKGDWNTAKAVFHSLRKPKEERDLLHLSTVLRVVLTREFAVAIVHVELEKLVASTNIYKENLKALKTYLK